MRSIIYILNLKFPSWEKKCPRQESKIGSFTYHASAQPIELAGNNLLGQTFENKIRCIIWDSSADQTTDKEAPMNDGYIDSYSFILFISIKLIEVKMIKSTSVFPSHFSNLSKFYHCCCLIFVFFVKSKKCCNENKTNVCFLN